MRRPMVITVQGKTGPYSFLFTGDPANLNEWFGEGFNVVEVEYVIPEWIAAIGLTRPYCRLVDLWRFVCVL